MRSLFRNLPVVLLGLSLTPVAALAQWAPNGVPVCVQAQPQSQPSACADDAGGVYIAWMDLRSGANDIYMQHLDASGQVFPGWPVNGLVVCDAADQQSFPRVSPDGQGGVYVAWEDFRSGTQTEIFAQRLLPTGARAAGWPVNGLAITVQPSEQNNVRLATAPGGELALVWEDQRGASRDLYGTMVAPDGTTLVGFPANGRSISAAGQPQEAASVIADANGMIVAWMDFRNGSHYDIYAQRVTNAGAVLWTAEGEPVCGAASTQSFPQLISDGAGGAILTWEDQRNAGTNVDIYAVRLTAAGGVAAGWTGQGSVISNAAGPQNFVTIAPFQTGSGLGGATIAWIDRRGATTDVYAQRVSLGGTVLGAANGTALCDVAGFQTNVKLVSDDAGGVMAVWEDPRNPGGSDIFGIHAGSTLAPFAGWSADGDAQCAIAGPQITPALISDGRGSAIVVWEDYRTGSPDIYAQRFGPAAVAAVEPSVTGAAFALRGPSPFARSTAFGLTITQPGDAEVQVVDLSGRRVRSLARGPIRAGDHVFTWDGHDDAGSAVAPGVYFVRAEAPGVTKSLRVVRTH